MTDRLTAMPTRPSLLAAIKGLGKRPDALLRALRGMAQEIAGGLAGQPDTPYGNTVDAMMALGRSLRPGSTYGAELENIKAAREQQYPGIYSQVPGVAGPARSDVVQDYVTGMGPGMVGPLGLGLPAQAFYHGTPHPWEGAGAPLESAIGKTFDLSKIGTGEGAQAYGWGAYATKEPNVAESYRRELLKQPGRSQFRDVTYNGEPLATNAPDTDFWPTEIMVNRDLQVKASAKMRDYGVDIPTAFKMAHDDLMEQALKDVENVKKPGRNASLAEYYQGRLDRLNALDPSRLSFGPERTGRLYKLEGPEDEELLHWDKPISEQPHILEKLPALGLESPLPGTTGKDLYHHLVLEEQRKLGINSDTVWPQGDAPRLAAERLRAAGIPGHLYTGDTSGVQNAVIYDPAEAPVVAVSRSLTEAPEGFTTPLPPRTKRVPAASLAAALQKQMGQR